MTNNVFLSLVRQQEGRCAYCNSDLRELETHGDHIVPYSYSMSNSLTGMCIACKRCNLKKGSYMLDEGTLITFIADMIASHGSCGEGWPEGAEDYWTSV